MLLICKTKEGIELISIDLASLISSSRISLTCGEFKSNLNKSISVNISSIVFVLMIGLVRVVQYNALTVKHL